MYGFDQIPASSPYLSTDFMDPPKDIKTCSGHDIVMVFLSVTLKYFLSLSSVCWSSVENMLPNVAR